MPLEQPDISGNVRATRGRALRDQIVRAFRSSKNRNAVRRGGCCVCPSRSKGAQLIPHARGRRTAKAMRPSLGFVKAG